MQVTLRKERSQMQVALCKEHSQMQVVLCKEPSQMQVAPRKETLTKASGVAQRDAHERTWRYAKRRS